MNESIRMSPQFDEADTEVELSAQDLLALSDPLPAPSRKLDAPKASADRSSRLAIAIIAIVSIAGVAHVLKPSERASQSTAETSQPASPSEQVAKDQPVRFSNPFDKNEVFEFPAGTTETEARDAVAAVLMERAMSRQDT
ncbi:MAG TPA: hypothetical protein VGD45_21960 [Steroidobacter sp.]|uniref:hypothetical protein n=1 Tax=Steroidobacter sp. TaxID=1978227 RepID=UPI002ED8DD2D